MVKGICWRKPDKSNDEASVHTEAAQKPQLCLKTERVKSIENETDGEH